MNKTRIVALTMILCISVLPMGCAKTLDETTDTAEEAAETVNDGTEEAAETENDGITEEITDDEIEEIKEELRNAEYAKYISGLLASYKYIDRDIELEYFYDLDNTSTYEQILEEIGEPNGQVGSGIVYKYYEIDDNLYVVIYFYGSENKPFDRVGLIRLCSQEEILDTIYPR
ncbi:MAG: hypothetical protein K2K17_07840 [Lachnospiraceae bacterium]|nr:hypothetical protein [Lachnospiraceae bacterium]